jgi:hypothetical protein
MVAKLIVAAGLVTLGVISIGSMEAARVASRQLGTDGVRTTTDGGPAPVQWPRLPKLVVNR